MFETARSVSNEEHSNFDVRFVSQEKDSNVPARSVLVKTHSHFSALSQFYETETVPDDSLNDVSFPVDYAIDDIVSVN